MWSNFVIYCVLPAHLNCASTGMNQERRFWGQNAGSLTALMLAVASCSAGGADMMVVFRKADVAQVCGARGSGTCSSTQRG